MKLRAKDIKRFWAKVDIRSAVECWPWKACIKKGYGMFGVNGRMIGAHRVAYILSGRHLGEKHALHTCDFPLCCNPAHLFKGTTQDNTADAVSKHRMNHGEGVHTAKLTNESVLEIRRRYQRGVRGCGYKSLSREFGVDVQTVKAVVIRRNWRLAELEAPSSLRKAA